MKRITILLKPTEECNFRCGYCYHADTNFENGRMSLELFEEIIDKIVSCYNNISLTFHGGEPLLMGYDFYEKALAIIEKKRDDGANWQLSIQTNGYLLNEEFCRLFKAHGFSPSVSFDGPGELNCLRDKTQEVTNNIIDLKSKGYDISLLGVITKKNVASLLDFYNFARKYGFHCKFNPVFESGYAKGQESILISPNDFINAIKELLPVYIKDEKSTLIEPLASMIYMALSNRHAPVCEYSGCLHRWLAIGHDGSLYPCSRSYPQDYYLGNIKELDNIFMAFENDNFANLLKGAIERRNFCKATCDYYSTCQGGCNNDSILSGNLNRPAGFKCKTLKTLIPFIKDCIMTNMELINNKYVLEIIRRSQNG